MIPLNRSSHLDLHVGCVEACRACAHRALSAAESENQKEQWLRRHLEPWAEQIAPIRAVSGHERFNYRDRVCLTTVWSGTSWHFGLMAGREFVPIPDCPIHTQRIRTVVKLLMKRLPPASSFPLVFFVQSGAQLVLVVKCRSMPAMEWLDDDLRFRVEKSGLEGLWLHLHPAAGRRIFAKREWHLVWGQPRSRDDNGLLYGPASFQQLIPHLHLNALDEAETFFSPTTGDLVVDLYSGTGTTLARWAKAGARTVGVELGAESVRCALENVPEALVLRGTCTHRLPQLSEWVLQNDRPLARRTLYANPPRTGIEPEVIKWITQEYRPDKIAYLSCSAGTLRRDLDMLTRARYNINRIIPYDFFPGTRHVETLVLISL